MPGLLLNFHFRLIVSLILNKMGNIMAIDIGIVLVSITIFDKRNSIFPVKIKEAKTKCLFECDSYFEVDQSFYSIKHGGTFHFAHFNIHYFREFLESNAFDAIMTFVENNCDVNEEQVLFQNLALKNMVTDVPFSPDGRRRSFTVSEDELSEETKDETDDNQTTEHDKIGGGFPSEVMLEEIIEEYGVVRNLKGRQLLCTGGYNSNFAELISALLNVRLYKVSKYLSTIISAIDYQKSNFYSLPSPKTENIYKLGKIKTDKNDQILFSMEGKLYPYLLVNLRSGASFIRVNSKTEYKRVIGTSIGAGTFVGIMKLINPNDNLTETIAKSFEGDTNKVDMSVGDIYGEGYEGIGLPAEVIASSFGKVIDKTPEEIEKLNQSDISLSLMNLVMFNTLNIANLVAQIEDIKNIVLVGHHLRIFELEQLCEMGFNLLNGGKSKLMFVNHSSYLGSLGLMIEHGGLDTLFD